MSSSDMVWMCPEHNLSITWHDSAWIPVLNAGNVLDYFSERSNPFYDRQCNNEIIKMQRLSQDHLVNMTGTEYIVLHVQEPILYIIRKQYRHSQQHVTPQVDYYIIAGTVYQAPDLGSVLNCRLVNSVHNLQSAFEEAQSFSRYHPSKGYWWDFNQQDHSEKDEKKKKKDEPGSIFQRQRVDLLLGELAKKFPPKFVAPTQPEAKAEDVVKVEPKQDVKHEKPSTDKQTDSTVKPPPDKRQKLAR
ncbi:mediator of RNA polymerase II transcription subunit 6-like isoform X1 [Ruditapes philippinarum]|uniref:mediator of RNA polymerase II transcription subunit 6-like isoform X1 n=1 Tax=Ruditapes philippinarum TaxID=129788 RepID=UPI00295ADC6D|nr:mediator of RNA polymerase II transcription subunit 6-like isoform X1 [Ruditapes philippinarum]